MKNWMPKMGLAALYLSMTSPAYAYLDGATGSMLLQAIIGGVATAMVFGRVYLAKFKAFFSRNAAGGQSKGEAE